MDVQKSILNLWHNNASPGLLFQRISAAPTDRRKKLDLIEGKIAYSNLFIKIMPAARMKRQYPITLN